MTYEQYERRYNLEQEIEIAQIYIQFYNGTLMEKLLQRSYIRDYPVYGCLHYYYICLCCCSTNNEDRMKKE